MQIKPGLRSALCISKPNSGSSSRKVVFPNAVFWQNLNTLSTHFMTACVDNGAPLRGTPS